MTVVERGLATANLGQGNPDRILADLERLMRHAAVAGLQEAGNKQHVLDRAEAELGLMTYRGDGSRGAESTPLIWDPKRVRPGDLECVLVLPASPVGPGAGPSTSKPKYVVGGPFEDLETGEQFVVGNLHGLASVYMPKRRKFAKQMMSNAADWADRQEHDTALLGDFNMRRSHRYLKPLREAGFKAGANIATHRLRGIDHVWTDGIARRGQRVLRTVSDHHWLILDIALKPKEKPPVAHKYLPANLPQLLRDAGLEVIEVEGWRTRGRPESTGGFAPFGIDWHHTGAYDSMTDAQNDVDYADWLAKVGRSDLPPPLCQLSISAEGRVFVCAAGRANHAGKARAAGPMPAGDGNEMYVGVECMNSGKQGWPKPQYDAMVTTGAVLSKLLDCPASHNRGHVETSTTGKWDPGMLDLDTFRADIRQAMKPKPEPGPTKVQQAHIEVAEALADLYRGHKHLLRAKGHLEGADLTRPRVAQFLEELTTQDEALVQLRRAIKKSDAKAPPNE